ARPGPTSPCASSFVSEAYASEIVLMSIPVRLATGSHDVGSRNDQRSTCSPSCDDPCASPAAQAAMLAVSAVATMAAARIRGARVTVFCSLWGCRRSAGDAEGRGLLGCHGVAV